MVDSMYLAEVEYRRAEVVRNRENHARLAQSYAVYKSTGQGSLRFRHPFTFGLTFVEEPRMGYGSVIDLDDLGDKLDHEPGEVPTMPHCTGYVVDWDTDNRGFYVGASLAVRVTFPLEDLVPVTLQVAVTHHFTFSGVAMKDVPVDIAD